MDKIPVTITLPDIILTKKELAFCRAYCDYGCSGVEAVYEAGYKPKNRRTAASMASQNLTKLNILRYIHEFFEKISLTNEEILHEHWFLIKQNGDLHVKAKAIDMYYKKNGMYAVEKQDGKPQTVVITDYAKLPDEQLQTMIEQRLRRMGTLNGKTVTFNKQ